MSVIDPDGNVEFQTLNIKATPEHLANAVLSVRIDSIGRPTEHQLLQNYPNPFNPETWIPYHLSKVSDVQISIYDTHGSIIRHLALGHQPEGYYTRKSRAAY